MPTKAVLCARAGLGVIAALIVAGQADAKPARHGRRGDAEASTKALEDQVKALQAEISSLQSWRDAEMSHRAQTDQQVSDLQRQLADAQAQAREARAAADAQIQTIPGVVKKEVAAEVPHDGKLHEKGVSITFGGFAAMESVYRSKNEIADIGSNYAKIPFDNAPLAHTQELRGSARQSRLSMLAEGDINPTTHAAFYTELDFLAGPQTANSNESNSFSPRIRNVYGTLDYDDLGLHFLAGQSWSLATLNAKGISPRNEVPPPTIEAQYVVGFAWARQPQLRIVGDFLHKQLWAGLSVENPQTTFASAASGVAGTSVNGISTTINGTPTSQFASINTLSLNRVPDIIGKVAIEPEMFGGRPVHAEIFGIYRNFYDRVNVAPTNGLGLPAGVGNSSVDGGGFGWGVTWTVVPKYVDLETSGLTGRGLGRYGSTGLPDVVVGPDGRLKPIPETMFLGGGTLHASRALDIYVFGGEERQKAVYSNIGGSFYGFGAPSPDLSGCAVEGASCSPNIRLASQITAGLWDKVYQGKFGSVRVGLQYSYTELTGFPDAHGYEPHTHDHMIFTSVRYYPF